MAQIVMVTGHVITPKKLRIHTVWRMRIAERVHDSPWYTCQNLVSSLGAVEQSRAPLQRMYLKPCCMLHHQATDWAAQQCLQLLDIGMCVSIDTKSTSKYTSVLICHGVAAWAHSPRWHSNQLQR